MIPGAFPSTPPSTTRFQDKTPTAIEFNFTPKSQSLYPNLDHLTSSGKSSLRLDQECEKLGYSKKLSNNVLQELEQRAATKVTATTRLHSNKSTFSPRNSRYNNSHRSRFSKMDSISSHYAASRQISSKPQGYSNIQGEEMEIDKENIPSYDAFSKRSNVSVMASASKRRRTELGTQQIHHGMTPSRGSNNLKSILNSSSAGPVERSRLPTSSSRQMLKPAFEINSTTSRNHSISQSDHTHQHSHDSNLFSQSSHTSISSRLTSSTSLKTPSLTTSRTISGNISKLTTAKQLPKSTTMKDISRSTTMRNLAKPTTSSLSKSTSIRSLRSEIETPTTTTQSLRTSKSSYNLRQSQSKPAWR